jgi:hypothetical protein
MRKKKTTKLKPQDKREKPKEKIIFDTLSFHETFPFTLIHKDGKEDKVCYFVCQEHLDKYIFRYKLNKKDYTISKTKPKKLENESL